MPKYGLYQTVNELQRGALVTVWSARRSTDEPDAPPRYAVKACKPDADIAGPEYAARQVADFLDSARLQQQLAAEKPDLWAPIHDISKTAADDGWGGGSTGGEGGAFAVTDLYPRSADRLISARALLDSTSLVRLMRAALHAAGHVAASTAARGGSRPHGNLSARNLLIASGAAGSDLHSAVIHACDPLPSSRLDPDASHRTDVRALGELLYQFVTWQPFQPRGVWPVSPSPSWNRLGPGAAGAGAKWLALCNRLLDPNPAEPCTLDHIAAALDQIAASRQSSRSSKKLVLIGGCVLLLVAAAATYVLTRPPGNGSGSGGHGGAPPPPTPISQEDWARLCDDYANWLSLLARDLNAAPATFGGLTRAEFYATVIPELRPVLDAVRTQAPQMDPRLLVPGGAGRDRLLSDLGRTVPEAFSSPAAVKPVADAITFVHATRETLFGERSLLASPFRQPSGALYQSWVQAGWSGPAKMIGDAAASLDPSKFELEQLDRLVLLHRSAGEIETLRAAINTQTQTLASAAPDDPVLQSFSTWATAFPAARLSTLDAGTGSSDPLATLRFSLQSVRKVGESLVRYVTDGEDDKWSRVCRQALIASERYQDLAKLPPSEEVFVRWRQLATQDAFPLPSRESDPRVRDLSIAAVQARLASLRDLPQSSLSPEALGPVLTKLKDAIVAMGGEPPPDRATALSRAAELIDQWWAPSLMDDCVTAAQVIRRGEDRSYRTVADALSEAESRYQSAVAVERLGVQARVDQVWDSSPAGVNSESLVSAWATLKGPKPSPELPDARRNELATAAERTLASLRALCDALPPWTPPAELGDAQLRSAMSAASLRARDVLLKQAVDERTAAGPLDRTTWTDAALEPIRARYQQSIDQFTLFASTAAELRLALAGAFGFDEPRPQARSIQTLVTDLQALPGYADLRAGIASLESRVAALRAVEQETDPARLAQVVGSPSPTTPELTLAAWRRLAAARPATPWPGTLPELEQELRFGTLLRVLVQSLDPAARADQDALQTSISAERTSRWKSFVRRASSVSDIEAALQPEFTDAQLGGFGVSLSSDLAAPGDAPIRFRWLLRDLTKRAASLDDQTIKQPVLDFVTQARPVALAAQAPAVSAFLDALEAAASRSEDAAPKVDLAQIGPGKAGWTLATPPTPGADLSYTRGGATLDFLLVAPPGAPSAYLARTELSVAQFHDIIDAASAWDSITGLMDPAPGTSGASDTGRAGPRAWEPDTSRKLRPPARDWLSFRSQFRQAHPYAPRFRSPPNPRNADDMPIITGRVPDTSPMQYIPPAPALIAARLVGCRFPTPAEWQAAAAAAPPPVNLRDAAWKAQFDYGNADANPGAGSFFGDPGASPTTASEDDDYLWFRPVADPPPAPGQFAHLLGNVAEYVLNIREADLPLPGPTLAASCSSLLDQNAAQLFVVGGSALGPPTDHTTPAPLPP
ncbi:MAG: hypothetical protein AB7G11_14030, partial [Phycisphaerales bacterium]